MPYTRAVITRTLQCNHPAVVTFWESGGMSFFDNDKRVLHFYHVITIDERRLDVEARTDEPDYEKKAFEKIDQWLDEQYPEIKNSLDKIRS